METVYDLEGKKEHKVLNYFLVYYLTAMSSIPFFVGDIFLIGGFLLTLFLFLARGKTFDRVLISYCLVFLALFGVQVVAFGDFKLNTVIAYMMRICFAYFTVKVVGRNFDKYFVNIIFYFSIIGLIFTGAIFANPSLAEYIFSNIVPFFDSITYYPTTVKHFLIYTMELGYKVEVPRNSGPFWEPGGFGVFLFIALTFNIVRNKSFFNKKNVIFLISIFTTQSTTAYIAFFVFIFIYIVISNKAIYSLILIPVIVFLFITVYSNLSFMDEKINKMYEESTHAEKKKVYSRIVSGKVNVENFLTSPIFGIGRYFTIKEDENSGNNGVTLLLAEFGLIGFGYFFLMMFSSYREYCKMHNFNLKFPIAIIAALLVLGFSQGLFQKPFFMGLCFMYLVRFDNVRDTAQDMLQKKLAWLKHQRRLL
jgi:hypothetical protein